MPDLTIEIMAMCDSMSQQVHTEGGYTQTNVFSEYGLPHCTCPAFKFSKGPEKTCKHIRKIQNDACGWHQQYSEEVQTEEGKCPRCGGTTSYVRVAV